MSQTAEVIQSNKNEIAAFSEFRSQLAQLKHDNEKAVFIYADPKGNKDARSHVYKLRQTKSAVEKVRKEQKAEALEYGRKVDSQAKEISSEIDSMIDVHEAPLKAIEEKEAARIQAHKDNIDRIHAFLDPCHASMNSAMVNNYWHELEELEPDEKYEEFTAEALLVYKKANEYLKQCHESASLREKEQAELQKLKEEAAERERRDNEERIAREAREQAEQKAKAQAEAAERAAKEREEAAKREREEAEARLKQQAEQAERQAKEAEQRAKDAEAKAQRDIKEAAERAERERAELARAEQAELEKREANKKHRAAINNAAVDALIAGGVDAEQAKAAITLIAKGEVPSVKINY